MAMQQIEQSEDLMLAWAFLADRGVHSNPTGEYQETAIVEAIRATGWEPEVTGITGAWDVTIGDRVAPTRVRYSVASDADRTTALLRALQMALTWLTPEEERRLFDEQARKAFGVSGDEVLRRWDAGELPSDDPDIRHLLMLRPLGR